MATQCSNYWKYYKLNLFSGKTFSLILMQPGFSFNRGTMEDYADISASEVAAANGYSTGGFTLSGISVTKDNTNNRGLITWSNVSFTPTGGNVSFCGAIVLDETDDVIVGFIDAGGTIIATEDQPYSITNISVEED